ncbi:triadin-like isoform X3 [Pseudochaenichthys georgianus]|uniref:triadin-like isoform X3 n=1 Tax=Pseudochaenichthys georgianus TaxID=52239 RepID=UPI0039C27C15
METKLPTLRPKKKLCYHTNKDSPTKKVEGLMTMEDIDRMFDDLDPPCDDLLPSSSRYMTFNVEADQRERGASTGPHKGKLMGTIPKGHMGPKGDGIHSSRSPSPELVIDQDIPFKAHMPAKTSSPIETNMAVKALIEKDRAVSPLLFACEDEGDAKREPPPNGHVTEKSIDFEFESPPSKVVLSRPKKSSQQNKVEEARKETQTLSKNPPQKPQTPVVEVRRKTPRIEMGDPPAARREPELAAPEKTIETVPEQPLVEPVRVQNNIAAFIQKLRDAAQSKPACMRKSASPVKVPTPPPEPEDDFLILEDDAAPFWISIRSKTAKKQKRSGTTSIAKASVTDKSTKGSSAETQQEPEETERKPRGPSGKRKTKEKKNEVTEADRAEEEIPGPEEPPVDSIDEKKPNKKKKQRLKKVLSEDSDEEGEPPKTSKETREDEPAVRIDKKALNSKTLKYAKTIRAKPMKRAKKVPQGSDGETDKASKKQGPSGEEVGATDLGALSDEDSADVKRDKNNKLPLVSEGSSPDDCLTRGRRKTRPPGEWWMHRSPEETTGKCNQPPVKEATRQNTEPSAAAASPVRPKKDKCDQLTIKKYKKPNQEPCGAPPVKDKVLKNINPTQPAAPTSQKTNKENKPSTGGETQGEESHMTEAEPFEEEEEEQEEEQEEQQEEEEEEEGKEEEEAEEDVLSSPLVFSHRELSDNSGEKPFPKEYHPVSRKKKAPQKKEPQRKEPLKAVRRGRRPPGSWWTVPDVCEHVESVSPQQQKPKPRKEGKKRTRSPPPPKESSSVPLPNPQSPEERCRAASEDMVSSTETPSVGRGRMKRRKEPERPVEEIPPADCSIFSTPNDLIHHSTPEDEGPQRYSVDRSKLLRSGPSSMIVLDQYEEEDSLILPNSTVQAALSLSDLCAPPLKPMTLLTQDKANLAEWFTNLWALPVKVDSTEISPDQFEWFCYQGRVIGFTMDVNSGPFCNGKMLLGSFMKKPLWVDHSAATVFNLLTSSVSVTINGRESRFNPGKSFMVPCGSAYSIQNVYAQPAVLYFTRMITESSE